MISTFDRMKQELAQFVENVVGRRLRYALSYAGTVISQDGSSNQLTVLVDDREMKGSGASSIVIKHGMPGVKVEVQEGTRVVVQFDAADPSKPYVASFDEGQDTVTKIELGNASSNKEKAARDTDPVIAGYLMFDATTPALYWAPDVSGAPGTYVAVAPTVGPPAPGAPGTPLTGEITDGSGVVYIED